MISIKQAWKQFESEVKPLVIEQYGNGDSIALSEAWNNYTDSLCKDGEFTELQYHYCPSDDDACIFDDDDAEFLIEQMGIDIDIEQVNSRPDGLMGESAKHYEITISRGKAAIEFYFSTGSAITYPDRKGIVECILDDRFIAENCSDFDDFCDDLGYDNDSISAKKIYKACKKMKRKVDKIFTPDECEQLQEILREL